MKDRERRTGRPITYNNVIDFHLMLKDVYGIDKNERDFFARFQSRTQKKEEPKQKPVLESKVQAAQPKSAPEDLGEYLKITNRRTTIRNLLRNSDSLNDFYGLNWEDTHYSLQRSGLYMPSPAIFMPHFLEVLEAAKGKRTLETADSKPISREEATKLAEYYTSGLWIWLDAMFHRNRDSNTWSIETDHRVIVYRDGTTARQGKVTKLEDHVNETNYVNLKFNSQGFPTEIANPSKKETEYRMTYHPPKGDYVVWFSAVSRPAITYGRAKPNKGFPGLGTIPCIKPHLSKQS